MNTAIAEDTRPVSDTAPAGTAPAGTAPAEDITGLIGRAAVPVSAAAELVGLSTYTLRWYEQEGLLEPVGRDSAGRRRYTQRDLDWLTLLTRLRRTGMPVRDMRRYAELARQGDGTLGARRRLFEEHRDRVLQRMAQLEEDLTVLNYKIDMYGQMERETTAQSAGTVRRTFSRCGDAVRRPLSPDTPTLA